MMVGLCVGLKIISISTNKFNKFLYLLISLVDEDNPNFYIYRYMSEVITNVDWMSLKYQRDCRLMIVIVDFN